ncbi:hypothetical protein ACVLD2_003098 [Paenibacillus sp. PvR052]
MGPELPQRLPTLRIQDERAAFGSGQAVFGKAVHGV